MTGVGGRPEIVIEGSDSLDGPWKVWFYIAYMTYKPDIIIFILCSKFRVLAGSKK